VRTNRSRSEMVRSSLVQWVATILLILAIPGCNQSSASRPTAPSVPVDPNRYVNVHLNCSSSGSGWIIATQDTQVFMLGQDTCTEPGGTDARIRFNPARPLNLTLTSVIRDGDSIRCKAFGRAYPAQDSVSHPPDVAYDQSRDAPDAITIHGPSYGCVEFPTPSCDWGSGSISVWVFYQNNLVGYWPDQWAASWGYPPAWPACGTAVPAWPERARATMSSFRYR